MRPFAAGYSRIGTSLCDAGRRDPLEWPHNREAHQAFGKVTPRWP